MTARPAATPEGVIADSNIYLSPHTKRQHSQGRTAPAPAPAPAACARADACHARAGSCDGPPTKLKLRVGGAWFKGPWPHLLPEQAREAPSGSRRRLRRGVYLPCRAAPTSAGCMPPEPARDEGVQFRPPVRPFNHCRAALQSVTSWNACARGPAGVGRGVCTGGAPLRV